MKTTKTTVVMVVMVTHAYTHTYTVTHAYTIHIPITCRLDKEGILISLVSYLDDDEDDRDAGSDEEPNHDSPAGKSHDKANAIMAEVAKNEADKKEDATKDSSPETKDDEPTDKKTEAEADDGISGSHNENK